MGLWVCHACDRFVYSGAIVCPWCDKSIPARGFWRQVLAEAIGIFVFVLFVIIVLYPIFGWEKIMLGIARSLGRR